MRGLQGTIYNRNRVYISNLPHIKHISYDYLAIYNKKKATSEKFAGVDSSISRKVGRYYGYN